MRVLRERIRGIVEEPALKQHLSREEFDGLVEQAVAQLPRVFREKLANVAIEVADLPPREESDGDSLMGVFQGVPITEKSVFQSSGPDRIVIYQKNIESACGTRKELVREIRLTLLHELGHYFGLSEAELEDI
jgi:predicted Zn-dependent protease with MMP-like domain